MNLWDETIHFIEEKGYTWNDVIGVCGNAFSISKENFEEVAKKTDYDAGYGCQEIAIDLMIVGKDWWLERHDYDGSEWWEYKEYPRLYAMPRFKVSSLEGVEQSLLDILQRG